MLLIRSPRELVNTSNIGYGWRSVNFSEYDSIQSLLVDGFKHRNINIGRKTNQVKAFYNLKKGDKVLIPLSGSIVFAEIQGVKSFETGICFGENRVSANYLKNSEGNIAYIPRKSLSTRLQSRLKIRTTIASLEDFQDEIESIFEAIQTKGNYCWSSEIEQKIDEQKQTFKKELLNKIRNGQDTYFSAGGYGLEQLIKEVLQAEGYDARITAKNQSAGLEDVDIIAERTTSLTGDKEVLLIQAKHHRGTTSEHGIKQLIAYNEDFDENCCSRKVLITTAELSPENRDFAEDHGVVIIDGHALIDWIFDNLEHLSERTRRSLGISPIPSFI